MLKTLSALMASLLLWTGICTAQNNGIFPLTGMRYFKGGIWAKSIAVKMRGNQLYGNRIPLDSAIQLVLEQPTGFVPDPKKNVFAAAELSLISSKGEVVWQVPNLLSATANGFAPKDLKSFVINFTLPEGHVQPNSNCIVRIRIYDLKSKNQLQLDYPVSIAYPREKIPFTKSIQTIKSPPGAAFMTTNLGAKGMTISVDTLVGVAPDMAYLHLEVLKINGTDIISLLQGKETFWVYDSDFNEIRYKQIMLKNVGGALEGGNVNCTLRIPFRPKAVKTKGYWVRYRWESPDKSQVFDIVVNQ